MAGTTLLTGGSGRTATRIAKRLQSHGIPVLLTSRRGQAGVPEGFKGVTFDWYDPSTYPNLFDEDSNIDTIYIIVPPPKPGSDSVELTKKLIDLSRFMGVKKFLFMSVSFTEMGGPLHGEVHAYLDKTGVDYAVLRPSWFFTNFFFMPSIKEKDEFITATGDAKIGFISEDDIADIAMELLLSPTLGRVEKNIVGPELISYNQVAEIFTQALNRKITHRNVTIEERTTFYTSLGLAAEAGRFLASTEANYVATGGEERFYSRSDKVVGKTKFIEFVEANKEVWMK